MSDRPSYKYTFNVSDSFISSSSYSVYYISDYNDMEYVVKGYHTEDKDSRKETRSKEGRDSE